MSETATEGERRLYQYFGRNRRSLRKPKLNAVRAQHELSVNAAVSVVIDITPPFVIQFSKFITESELPTIVMKANSQTWMI